MEGARSGREKIIGREKGGLREKSDPGRGTTARRRATDAGEGACRGGGVKERAGGKMCVDREGVRLAAVEGE